MTIEGKGILEALYNAVAGLEKKTGLCILMEKTCYRELVEAHEALTGIKVVMPAFAGIKVYEALALPENRKWILALDNN